MWEDLVIGLGNIVLSISLFSAVRDSQKPPLSTSIPTAITIYIFCIAQISLGLYLTTAVTFVVATLWAVLAWQRFRQGKVVVKSVRNL
ncbi:hypothetical protein KA529_00545 [Candidatus Saccharibacteria bacterium]|nr:hypothetical protein [Candidatus Saccharibacteria bacterium]